MTRLWVRAPAESNRIEQITQFASARAKYCKATKVTNASAGCHRVQRSQSP